MIVLFTLKHNFETLLRMIFNLVWIVNIFIDANTDAVLKQ